MPTEPTYRISPALAGDATPEMPVPRGSSFVAVGIAPDDGITSLASLAVRVELSLDGAADEGEVREFFDAGQSLDLNDKDRTRLVPVAGYSAVRLVVRTATGSAGNRIRAFFGTPE